MATGINPAQTLDEELHGARQLLKLLQQEKAKLLDGEIEKLEQLVDEKAGVIVRLLDLAKSRHRSLAAVGFQAREAGMQAWFDSGSPTDRNLAATRKRWSELIELTQSAKELNRVNGLLIGSHMARTQTAMNALRSGTEGSNVYGPDGQPSKNALGRSLVIS